ARVGSRRKMALSSPFCCAAPVSFPPGWFHRLAAFMREVLHILFGALFTVAVSTALGILLLRRLRLPLHQFEAAVFAFIAGAACLSFLMALLCLVHEARRGVLLWGGLAVIAAALWREKRELPRPRLPTPPASRSVLFYLIFAAFFAALLVYASPIIGMDGVAAYNDVAVATLLFADFYLLQVWDDLRDSKMLLLIGLLTGFAYGVKYTAFLAFLVAMLFVWWKSPRESARRRAFVLLTIPAAIMIAPWILRNWFWLGNPFAPFL